LSSGKARARGREQKERSGAGGAGGSQAVNKEEYREYISGEDWQKRRKQYLLSHPECSVCGISRWLSREIYKEDLHVHHVSYARVGKEDDSDLRPLCKRCHEIETFGKSDLLKCDDHAHARYCFWLLFLMNFYDYTASSQEMAVFFEVFRSRPQEKLRDLDIVGCYLLRSFDYFPGEPELNAAIDYVEFINKSSHLGPYLGEKAK
jgi:HNH endonuclease